MMAGDCRQLLPVPPADCDTGLPESAWSMSPLSAPASTALMTGGLPPLPPVPMPASLLKFGPAPPQEVAKPMPIKVTRLPEFNLGYRRACWAFLGKGGGTWREFMADTVCKLWTTPRYS